MGGSERRGRARCSSRLYRIWPPRAWCRQRCAKNDGFSALLTARSYLRAREQCRANVVLRRDVGTTRRRCRITMALVTVQRSPSVSSSPQSSVSVLCCTFHVQFVVVHAVQMHILSARYRPREMRYDTRRVVLASRSLARDSNRPSAGVRPAALPYLAVHWQPCEKGNLWEFKAPLYTSCVRTICEAERRDTRDTAAGPRSPVRKARRNKGGSWRKQTYRPTQVVRPLAPNRPFAGRGWISSSIHSRASWRGSADQGDCVVTRLFVYRFMLSLSVHTIVIDKFSHVVVEGGFALHCPRSRIYWCSRRRFHDIELLLPRWKLEGAGSSFVVAREWPMNDCALPWRW